MSDNSKKAAKEPSTAMEAAWAKAVQRYATMPKAPAPRPPEKK